MDAYGANRSDLKPAAPSGVLPHVVAGIDPKCFVDEIVGHHHLHLARQDSSWFEGLLSITELLDAATALPLDEGVVGLTRTVDGQHHHRPAPTRRFEIRRGGAVRREQRIDRRDLVAALRDGYSIIVNDVGRLVPNVRRLCGGLAASFQCPVVANAYLSPPSAQGFDIHYDRHDALIVQLHGAKLWDLFDSVIDDPLEEQHEPFVGTTEPNESLVLDQGDTLYLPAGHAHRARSAQMPSMHLTLSWYPPRRYELWSEVLKQLAFTERELRAPVRTWSVDIEVDRLRGALEAFSVRRDLDELVGAARSQLMSHWLAGEPEDIDIGLAEAISMLPSEDEWVSVQVMWRPAGARQIESSALGVKVVVPGRVVRVPPDCAVIIDRLGELPCSIEQLVAGTERSRARRVLEVLTSSGAIVVIRE